MPVLLVLLFVVVPLLEFYVLIQVGQEIGALRTVGLLLLVSVVGAWLVKREGVKAWRAVRAALAEGRMPAKEAADGFLILLGGAFLLTPGFLTDVAGIALLLPPVRAVIRRTVFVVAAARFRAVRVVTIGTAGARRMRDRRPGAGGDTVWDAGQPRDARGTADVRPADEPPPPPALGP